MLVLVGALTASPAVPMERQARTTTMLWVLTVPTTPRAAIKLTAKNQRRTLVGSAPRLIVRVPFGEPRDHLSQLQFTVLDCLSVWAP